MGTDNGTFKGNETELENNPFQDDGKETKLSRNELENYTIKQLVPLAKGKTHLKETTLSRLSKNELIDIILDIKDEPKSKARATRSESESDQIINFALDVLNGIKQSRNGNEINPLAKEMFKKSAVNKVDEARADGVIDNNKFNNVIMYASAGALIVDSLIGFENIPSFFEKMRNKFSKKKSDDTK
jgi:hypothetical protein